MSACSAEGSADVDVSPLASHVSPRLWPNACSLVIRSVFMGVDFFITISDGRTAIARLSAGPGDSLDARETFSARCSGRKSTICHRTGSIEPHNVEQNHPPLAEATAEAGDMGTSDISL